jgi:cytochrome c-type biogenesis protein CcmH
VRALALAVLALALAFPAAAPAAEASPVPSDVEDEVLCPTCETTLDQSNSPVARRMKAFIRARIAAGDSKDEIKAKLVDDFGEGILASPPREGFNLLAWWLPVAGLGAGALAVGALAWRWSRSREAEPPLEPEGASGTVPPAPPLASASRPRHEPEPHRASGTVPQSPERLDPELERRLDEELARFEA